jgi:EAL domain-containing protein (putative c-di-GMP-specific phosphodiesterase class I)
LPADKAIFLNAHPVELEDPDLLADLASFAHPGRVVIEVTEGARVGSTPLVLERVRALKNAGFRIAVDDLGAGYASLNSVALLEPEFVKIDMTLARDVHASPPRARMIRSIVEFAHAQDACVIVEGVESGDDADRLRELGCDWMQGYFFGRPGALPALENE